MLTSGCTRASAAAFGADGTDAAASECKLVSPTNQRVHECLCVVGCTRLELIVVVIGCVCAVLQPS